MLAVSCKKEGMTRIDLSFIHECSGCYNALAFLLLAQAIWHICLAACAHPS